ncbi:MAG: methionine synthase [Spirochaetota bacterium]
MKRIEQLYEEASRRILVLDGAMGTAIQRYALSEADYRGGVLKEELEQLQGPLKGCSDVLSLTRFDVIDEIYRSYIDAGADIITTNTFGANVISLRDYGLEHLCYEMNLAAAETARASAEAAEEEDGKVRFVAGSIGPTHKTASISPKVEDPGYRDVSFQQLSEGYTEQIRGLLDGGVDILLIETVFDTLNCKAALYAATEEINRRQFQLSRPFPIMVSGTLSDASGRTLSGQTVEAFIVSLQHIDLFSVGLNCSMGAEELRPYVETASAWADTLVSVHPNAGLPDQFGNYTQSARRMGSILEGFLADGLVNIVGGCCGTTAEHIAVLADLAATYSPRPRPEREQTTKLSGLEPLCFTPEKKLIHVGERTNVAGSRRFARLIEQGKYEKALSVARNQVEGGAQIIDVCMDAAMLDAQAAMVRFLNLIAAEPDIAKVPVMVDSSSWPVIEAGLRCLQGRGVVNSISLKNGEKEFIDRAQTVKRLGAAMVVMLFDEKGQADTFERKIETAQRSYTLLTEEANIRPQDIIIDSNVLAIATGMEEHDRYALDFIRAVEWIKSHLPGVKTSGGISNLSFSFRGNTIVREAMHTVFLYHAVQAGLDMAIVNPALVMRYTDIPGPLLEAVEDAVLARGQDASHRLTELAYQYGHDRNEPSTGGKPTGDALQEKPVYERLTERLMRGIADSLSGDLSEAEQLCRREGKPLLWLVEGPLMTGMREVGRLFGEGKMFLPQVVKSARVMKQAVELLQPAIEQDNPGAEKHRLGRVVFATVKGDVHDIGKNIVSVVLSCNSIEVVDLGVMVSADSILTRAVEEKADAVALSGLITPSLDEMIYVAEQMERRGLTIPLIVGGATTSSLHTAVKIAPRYSGPVLHAKDASAAVEVLVRLFSDTSRKELLEGVRQEYAHLRGESSPLPAEKRSLLTFVQAREKGEAFRDQLDYSRATPPRTTGVSSFEIPLDEVVPFINWKMLFHAWKVPFASRQAEELKLEALNLIEQWQAEGRLSPKAAAAIVPAGASGDDIVLFPDGDSGQPRELHMLRQQVSESSGLSLSDFVAPLREGRPVDWVGLFAVTSGPLIDDRRTYYEQQGETYKALLSQSIGDRLAEAGTEYLHMLVRRNIWGYAAGEELSIEQMLSGRYQGIRPAPGYPAFPDHSEKALILDLLGGTTTTGISLTENQAMKPASSTCGIYISHAEASYISIREIGEDQAEDYAKRKKKPLHELKKHLSLVVSPLQEQ